MKGIKVAYANIAILLCLLVIIDVVGYFAVRDDCYLGGNRSEYM